MFGEKLKQIRTGKGLSQKAFADILGTSSGYISEIEQGKKMPGSELLISLKRAFGGAVSLDWLLVGEDSEVSSFIAGTRVKEYRENLRLKRGEFAKLIGIRPADLVKLEEGAAIPPKEILDVVIAKTDINPEWLHTGVGDRHKGDNRTGDGQPFYYPETEEFKTDLMWKVLQTLQFAIADTAPVGFLNLSDGKRTVIRDLLYEDALRRDGEPDDQLARKLCSLAYCAACGKRVAKRRWQERWGVKCPLGARLEDVTIFVKAAPGGKCPSEGLPRDYITDSESVEVKCSEYYRNLVDDGSLIIVDPKGPR